MEPRQSPANLTTSKLESVNKHENVLRWLKGLEGHIFYTPQKSRYYICPICSKICASPAAKKVHMRVHTQGYKCKQCSKYFINKKKLTTHLLLHSNKPCSCSTCTRRYKQEHLLKTQIQIQKEIKPFVCKACKKSFKKLGNLLNHIKIHNNARPYTCGICQKSYTSSWNRDRHEFLHTGIKPFKCVSCEKCFTRNEFLKRHMRTHAGEKPYRCSYCDKDFSQSGGLQVHVRRCHTKEFPFKCEKCPKKFKTDRECRQHGRIHTR